MSDEKRRAPGLEPAHVDRVMEQMRSRGRSFHDSWAEYEDGTAVSYKWDAENDRFTVTRIDIVVGSFYTVDEITPGALKKELLRCGSLHEFREQGFEV